MDVVTLGAAKAADLKATRTLRRGLIDPNPGWTRQGALPAVMASAPTFTMSAANAATSISGGVQVKATDAPITMLGAGYVDAQSSTGWPGSLKSAYLTSSLSGTGRVRVEFETDADLFEFHVRVTATSMKYLVWVDGQPHAATPVSVTSLSGGAGYRLKVDFGSAANRRVLIEATNSEFIGIWLGPTYTAWKTSRALGPKVLWVGDSFSEGTGANWWWSSWAMRTGQILGWNVYPSAVGSTGYLANGGGGGKVKYRDRLAADVTALSPDVIVFSGGYNDLGSSASAVGAEAALLYAAAATANPTASIIVALNNHPSGITSTGAPTLLRDALQTAAGSLTTVDPILYPSGTSWITGSGYVGATTGSGNADLYTFSDGVHPSEAGHAYLGRRVAAALASVFATA